VQVDDLLTFRQFSKKAADEAIDVRTDIFYSRPDADAQFQYDEDVGRATGGDVQEDFISNLSRISQLTGSFVVVFSGHRLTSWLPGFSDPIYAEAYVKMHGFDIMLGA
jgi:coatomer subunit beta